MSGVSAPFDSDFGGSSITESLYLSENLRPITPAFNLFFFSWGICEHDLFILSQNSLLPVSRLTLHLDRPPIIHNCTSLFTDVATSTLFFPHYRFQILEHNGCIWQWASNICTSVANIFGSSGFSVQNGQMCLVFGDGCESATQLPSLPPFHAEVPQTKTKCAYSKFHSHT